MQDRHIKNHSDGEPVVDSMQNYILLLGYENATHTTLRFRRRLDTCDYLHDVPITVSSQESLKIKLEFAFKIFGHWKGGVEQGQTSSSPIFLYFASEPLENVFLKVSNEIEYFLNKLK